MYVYLNLPRLVSSPTTKHSNIRAIKMHSTLQFQNESRESPSRHQISVDLVMFLESTVHFYHYTLNTFHTKDTYLYLEPQARHLPPLLLIHSLIYTIMLSSFIYHQSPSIVQTLRLHESSPICFVLTNLSLPNTIVALPPSACVAVTLTQPHPTPTSYRASIHASIVH